MPESAQKKRNYEINNVLERILDQNPQIVISRIELFTEVYYPIAILEIEMNETTFEDFDLIPLSILRFVDAGVTTAGEIAGLMGLSPGYVQKLLDLLMGYGYLGGNGLTPLGAKSLEMEKKISRNKVRQKFQADALTGDLLHIGQQPMDIDLIGKDRTIRNIAHMPHIEGISMEYLNRQFREGKLTDYKKYRGDILNANVEQILRVECVDLQYVKAYLIKMQGVPVPFIITNQYDSSKKDFKERFAWQPIRMPDPRAYSEYGFDRRIQCYSEESVKAVENLYSLVCRRIVDIDEKAIRDILEKIYPFRFDTMDISTGRLLNGIPEQIAVYVNDTSFPVWDSFVFRFLSKYDPVRGYFCTHSRLMGLFVRFESQNAAVRKAAKAVQRAVKKYGRKELAAYLREQCGREDLDLKKIPELTEAFAQTRAEM